MRRALWLALAGCLGFGVLGLTSKWFWWASFAPWAKENEAGLNVLFTASIALATVSSVAIAVSSIREAKALREAQFLPYVTARLEQRTDGPHFLDLVVENEGGGPAFDVRFEVLKDIDVQGRKALGRKDLLARPWHHLGGGHSRRTFLLSMFDPASYAEAMEVKLQWKDAIGTVHENQCVLDAREFLGFSTLGEPALPKIAKELGELRKSIEGVTRGRVALEVVTETQTERARRDKKREKEWTKTVKAHNAAVAAAVTKSEASKADGPQP